LGSDDLVLGPAQKLFLGPGPFFGFERAERRDSQPDALVSDVMNRVAQSTGNLGVEKASQQSLFPRSPTTRWSYQTNASSLALCYHFFDGSSDAASQNGVRQFPDLLEFRSCPRKPAPRFNEFSHAIFESSARGRLIQYYSKASCRLAGKDISIVSSRIELSQPPQAGQILRPLRHPASADDVVQQVNLEELPRENQVACDFEVRFARGQVLRPFLAVQLPDCNQN